MNREHIGHEEIDQDVAAINGIIRFGIICKGCGRFLLSLNMDVNTMVEMCVVTCGKCNCQMVMRNINATADDESSRND